MAAHIGCPSCARTIADDVQFCPHCGHGLTGDAAVVARTSTSMKGWRGVLVFGVLLFLGLMVLGTFRQSAEGPTLNVSAARGVGGFTLTNRESNHIRSCEVTVLDRGDDEWTAVWQQMLAPMQTTSIPWSAFTAKGQPMPPYVGRERKYFTVSCVVDNVSKERRSAGLSF